jgi:hypothetical protein
VKPSHPDPSDIPGKIALQESVPATCHPGPSRPLAHPMHSTVRNLRNRPQAITPPPLVAGAQEENLHRRTDLWLFLEDHSAWVPPPGHPPDQAPHFYPLRDDAVLYSPNVSVFRGSEQQGYPLLQEPFLIDVVSCAAMANPALASATRLGARDTSELRLKIHSLLAACRDNGATRLVLSGTYSTHTSATSHIGLSGSALMQGRAADLRCVPWFGLGSQRWAAVPSGTRLTTWLRFSKRHSLGCSLAVSGG